jgi:hypothetical protein
VVLRLLPVLRLLALVDPVVWLRLAMSAFGVTTPMVSIVISVFMAGLALDECYLLRRWLGFTPSPRGAAPGARRGSTPRRLRPWCRTRARAAGQERTARIEPRAVGGPLVRS